VGRNRRTKSLEGVMIDCEETGRDRSVKFMRSIAMKLSFFLGLRFKSNPNLLPVVVYISLVPTSAFLARCIT
jgi:hypothetical protein